ncbi:MAG: hypothetical protein ACLT1W_10360 [Alistipes onderdonkii]
MLRDTVYFYYTWNDTGDEAVTTRSRRCPRSALVGCLTFHGTSSTRATFPSRLLRREIPRHQKFRPSTRRAGWGRRAVSFSGPDGVRFERAASCATT